MDLDETTAMAVAAFERFDAEIDDALLRALAGAFAVVACADGELAPSEVDEFIHFAKQSPAFAEIDNRKLERAFRDLCEAILSDFHEGRDRALDAVASVKGEHDRAGLVLRAARVAVLADHKTRKIEHVALAAIAKRLDIDPESLSE